MKFFLVPILILSAIFNASAGTVKKIVTARTLNQDTIKINVFSYQNQWGKSEIRLEAASLPRITSDINATLGYGRDLDDDGKIESWFMLDPEKGITLYTIPGRLADGQDVIQTKLFTVYQSSFRLKFAAAFGSILSYGMISVGQVWESQKAFYKEWMDLEEFRIRFEREEKLGNLTREQIAEGYYLLSEGYSASLKKLEKAKGAQYWGLVGADAALWVTGGVVFEWLSHGAAAIAQTISKSALAKQMKVQFGAFTTKQSATIKNRLSKVGLKRVVAPVAASAAVRLTIKQRFNFSMKALIFRGKTGSYLTNYLKNPIMKIAKAGMTEWKYIALNVGLQLGTEAYAKADEVMEKDPIATAQNVLSHPEIMQNVGYMTMNTALMTAVSSNLKSLKMRFAACGFIAAGNSVMSQVVLDGESDSRRLALDTSWEVIIGTAQVQFDLAALKYFEELSTKKKNPRLKLLGYAVVVVDALAGYYGYAEATRYVEEKDKIQLVPVLAEN